MKKLKRTKIIPQMFDVRPVTPGGDLDWEKVLKVAEATKKIIVKKGISIRKKILVRSEENNQFLTKIVQLGESKLSHEVPIVGRSQFITTKYLQKKSAVKNRKAKIGKKFFRLKINNVVQKWLNIKAPILNFRPALGLASLILIIGLSFLTYQVVFNAQKSVLTFGEKAYANLEDAKNGLKNKNFQSSADYFLEAQKNFQSISKKLNNFGQATVEISRFFPYLSKLSSGSYLAKAGEELSGVGAQISQSLDEINKLKEAPENVSLLEELEKITTEAQTVDQSLSEAQEDLAKVNINDLPSERRNQVTQIKSTVSEARQLIQVFLDNSQIFKEILGGNGPRKYLFLFQNNQEVRATGGFIGSYGVLDIFNGRVRNFFIDGIFNPDGQLKERIVPPSPIQKISVNWSLHDSNWWPDFPTSAEKAMWFYEKSGSPTVDGVIAMTPTVLEKLLSITGPIEMPDYKTTIDQNNFSENIQTEVEVNYDKTLNQPKKILADLAPKVLDKLSQIDNLEDFKKVMGVFSQSLAEKQIIIYSKNYDIEKKLSQLGWSGEVLSADKDYLSVINTNINGYKTDGVIEESINQEVKIQEDGSVVDNLTITRKHNGGKTNKEWWDKVNADYMRVYVPRGSRLLSAEGQTREFDKPPVNYDTLGFSRDSQVQMEENGIQIDEASGTRIYEEAGKTVFANWVYVSPQETVTIKYSYLLPFKINFNESVDSYSLVAQKQSGSVGSQLTFALKAPEKNKAVWSYPDKMTQENSDHQNIFSFITDLKTDKFFGVAWTKD